MKHEHRNKRRVVKGTSSAIVMSVLIHVGLFLLAGVLALTVVREVIPDPIQLVEPVRRPPREIVLPRINHHEKITPNPDRIEANHGAPVLPEMNIPEPGGMGETLNITVTMPPAEFEWEPTGIGTPVSTGNDLIGTYYDLKFTRSGIFAPVTDGQMLYNYDSEFLLSGCDPGVLDKFFRSPQKLYATYLCFPMQPSAYAPVAFGMPDDMASGGLWIVHYEGQLIHEKGITFRFVGSADDGMAICMDGEIVFAMGQGSPDRGDRIWKSGWRSSSGDDFRWKINGRTASVGDWVTLEPEVPVDIDIVLCDNNARNAQFVLCVQEQGVDYPDNWRNEPLLPIFKMDHLSHDELDIIYRNFAENEVDFVNGPIFRGY